ncbi:hypothetical protein Q3G72_009233 [Acer saccharum]|nr:hypothetical protein Q3G72_009233 [Acer saccharum]
MVTLRKLFTWSSSRDLSFPPNQTIKSNSSLFVYRTNDITVIILVYVDDVLLTENDDAFVQNLVEKLGQEFTIKDFGSLHYFLGVEVKPFSSGVFLPQQKYTIDLLHKTQMLESSNFATPMVIKDKSHSSDSESVDATIFRSIAGCPTTRRSTIGFCTFLGAKCVSWSSKKQPTVSRSSSEAEYRAMASTTAEITWLTFILRDIGVTLAQPPHLFCDNISAFHMLVNPMFHAQSKHIELDYHFCTRKSCNGSSCHTVYTVLVSTC